MTTIWTNRHGVPAGLANAVINDSKSTAGDYSITQLLSPPRIRWLTKRHDVEADVSERIWALIGKGVHAVLARSAADPERQLVARVGSLRVSGTLDSIELDDGGAGAIGGCIRDWKVTSVFTDADGRKEWETQLNLYRWLYANATLSIASGTETPFVPHVPRVVDRLQVTMIFRDWSAARAARAAESKGEDGYPLAMTRTIDLPVWDLQEAHRVIRERLDLHQAADASDVIPNACSDEERWYRPGTYAVRKEKRKTALRVLPSHEDAVAWAEHNGSPGLSIEHRPGRDVRCESWCAARSVCPHALSLPKPKPNDSNGDEA